MNLGFIGAGNMASAIIRGLVGCKAAEGSAIAVFDTNVGATATLAAELGVETPATGGEVVEKSDIIFLCVKPQVLARVLEELKPGLTKDKTVVSIAAGTPIATMESILGQNAAIIRVMPNVNMLAGESMSAMCANGNVKKKTEALVFGLLEKVGRTVRIEEKHFAIFTAIAGCSPAYAFVFIDAIARTAVEYGLPKDLATEVAAQAVLGSAKNLLETGENPWAMVDKVCSPGGTTIAGLAALQEEAFPAVVAKGIRAAYEKDLELQKN